MKRIISLVAILVGVLYANIAYADIASPLEKAKSKMPIVVYGLIVVAILILAVVKVKAIKNSNSDTNKAQKDNSEEKL